MLGTGRLDVLQRQRLSGVLRTDRAAQEAVAVKHPDFGEITRVVAGRSGS